jgi:hypothetical protein
MARGAVSKAKATEMILKAFPGNFTYDKEIRIPFQEDGEEIQLKCVLTCAKVNVEPNGDVAIPGEVSADINFEDSKPIEQKVVEPTQEEKDNVKKLMETFGL